ncbi:endolytic transglycosylase MltG [Escherichia coli]|nr:endolytic transglycosylase MltG [Escherichia coli]
MATLHPEKHNFYYFVSRGDGTSEFSANLAAHNRAVAKYILKR